MNINIFAHCMEMLYKNILNYKTSRQKRMNHDIYMWYYIKCDEVIDNEDLINRASLYIKDKS